MSWAAIAKGEEKIILGSVYLIAAEIVDEIAKSALDDLVGKTYQIGLSVEDLENAISQGSVSKSIKADGTKDDEGIYQLKFSLSGRSTL